jgi:ATP-dependent protease ClpP protease subunit
MIEIIGTIGVEATARSVRAGLEESRETVELYIDSPGGDVIESNAISLALAEYSLQHPEKTYICTIGSLCASAAANILAKLPGCFTVRAYKDTLIMYHSCSGIIEGNPDQLRDQAMIMQLVNEAVISALAGKTTLGMETIRSAFCSGRELWLDGAKAVECGLVAELIDAEPDVHLYASDARTSRVLALVAEYKQKHMEANMAEEEKKEEAAQVAADASPAVVAETAPVVAEETELEKEEIAEEVEKEKEEAPEVDWEAECTKLRQECDDLKKEVDALKALVAKYSPSATATAQKTVKADWLTLVRELNAKHLPEQEYAREYVALKRDHKPEFDAFMQSHTKR